MRFALVVSMILGLALPAWATSGTCTVSSATLLVLSQGFTRGLPGLAGYPIPVDITESTGAVSMDFSGFPTDHFNISGVDNSVRLEATTAGGTLDASGHLAFAPIPVHFTTDLAVGQDLGGPEALISGISAVTVSGVDYVTEGAPLDFSTGVLRIEGQIVITNAPVVGVASSGLSLVCTLAPVPPASSLPASPLMVVRGKTKPGAGSNGDTIMLKARIKGTVDAPGDAFVRIAVGDTTVMLLRVPGDALTHKGKKSAATDTDGSTVRVVIGQKEGAADSGSVAIVQAKKRSTLALKHTGTDLAALSSAGSATVTVAIGSTTVSDDVTIKSGSKKIVLK